MVMVTVLANYDARNGSLSLRVGRLLADLLVAVLFLKSWERDAFSDLQMSSVIFLTIRPNHNVAPGIIISLVLATEYEEQK